MKKNVLISILALFAFATETLALPTLEDFLFDRQPLEKSYFEILSAQKSKEIEQAKSFVPVHRRPYDVLRYDLFMDWKDLIGGVIDWKEGVGFDGINKILLKIDSANVEKLVFDAVYLNVKSVKINGTEIENYSAANGTLEIPLAQTPNVGDSFAVEIAYSFFANKNGGLWAYPKGYFVEIGPKSETDSVFIEENIAYTMSEPRDARLWMPCNDYPYDKALSSIAVKVPDGYVVASNGLLDSVVSSDDGKIFYWSAKKPMATYLMHAAATKFHYFYDIYRRVSNPDDSIKIEYFVWEKDYNDTTSDGTSYNARDAMRNVPEMVRFFSQNYGEYPYAKYGVDVVQKFWPAGMEHQTITTVNRSILRRLDKRGWNRDWSNQIVLAHELSHQWLGDWITCASWNDLWINEGGATWSEALWASHIDSSFYYMQMDAKKQAFFYYDSKTPQPSVYAPPANNVFNYPTTYCKAGWIYHMLSEMLGRERFLGIIRDMLSAYGGTSIDSKDFENFVKEKAPDAPIDISTFFNQWLYSAGYPVFEVDLSSTYNSERDYYDVKLTFEQVQSGIDVPEVFKTPVWLFLYGADGKVLRDSVVVDKRKQTFNFVLTFRPDSVKLDGKKLLFKATSTVGVKEIAATSEKEARIIPNPVSERGKFRLSLNSSARARIFVIDALGNEKFELYDGDLAKGAYEFSLKTENLAAGYYFVVYSLNGTPKAVKFAVYK